MALRPYDGAKEPDTPEPCDAAHRAAPGPVLRHLQHLSAAQPREALLQVFPARSAFRKNTGSCAPAHRRQKWLSRVACNRARHTLKFGAHLGRTRPRAAPSTCDFQPGRAAPLSENWGHLLTCQTALRCSAQEPDRKAVRGTDPDRIKEAHACLCALSP